PQRRFDTCPRGKAAATGQPLKLYLVGWAQPRYFAQKISRFAAIAGIGRVMLRIAIQVDFAGGYGRGVLRGAMQYAQLRSDWEFVMPPMYSLASRKFAEPRPADGVIAMLHAPRSLELFRRQRIPVVNAARTMSVRALREIR